MKTLEIDGAGDPSRLFQIFQALASSAAHNLKVVPVSDLGQHAPELAPGILDFLQRAGNLNPDNASLTVLETASGRVSEKIAIGRCPLVESGMAGVEFMIARTGLAGSKWFFTESDDVKILTFDVLSDDETPIYVVGSSLALGAWDTRFAIPAAYTGVRGWHHFNVDVPAITGQPIAFKFLKKSAAWETGDNRVFDPSGGGGAISDYFRV